MNKKASFFALIFLIMITILTTYAYIVNKSYNDTLDCLYEIAEDYCEEKSLLTGDIITDSIFSKITFECLNKREALVYKFAREEIMECKNEN